jgi:hypothetical protein
MENGMIVFTNLAVQLPQLVVLLVGLVIALITWKRNPRPSLWALIGFSVFIILIIVGSLTSALPLTLSQRNNLSMQSIGTIVAVLTIIISLFHAVGWGFLIAAVFSARKKTA